MKKLFFVAVIAAIMMMSCSKNEDNRASLSKKSYTLYHSQTEIIQGTNVSALDWEVDNEFVATVSEGVITGQFVGTTSIKESAYQLSFNVEVLPKYNLYDEPCLDFGVATMETIRSMYGTPASYDSESLIYNSNNKNAPYYIYLFRNGRLYSSGVVVKLSAGSALADFLMERYLTVDVNMNTYTATFAHCYGKLANPQYDYSVGFTYSSSIGGLLVVYVANSSIYTRGIDLEALKEDIEDVVSINSIRID